MVVWALYERGEINLETVKEENDSIYWFESGNWCGKRFCVPQDQAKTSSEARDIIKQQKQKIGK